MRLVLSTPTSRGGGSLLLPCSGVAHLETDEAVGSISLRNVTIDDIAAMEFKLDGEPAGDADLWFEDSRERTH